MIKETLSRYGLKAFQYDIGADGKNMTALMEFDNLLEKSTWELPIIKPTSAYTPLESNPHTPLSVSFINQELDGVLAVTAQITNNTAKTIWLNGFTFDAVQPYDEGVRFRFPANVPHGTFDAGALEEYMPVQAGLVNFAVAFDTPSGGALNLLFIDEEEKWATGVWRCGNDIHTAFCAALEIYLAPGQSVTVGTLYIQPSHIKTQLTDIRRFVSKLGYSTPTGGCDKRGIMYSCHPHGTMDANFKSLSEDLFQFADRLPELADMGIRHVWLLPIFDHSELGVYHSNDQDIIDQRYGGEEGAKYFCEKARELGMTVLFDYVPHGPAPSHPLAQSHPDWCAKQQDGSLQIEWQSVSMDYNHSGYLAYTTDLVAGHVRRFGIQGARIDCAMGGLSNWRPVEGKRPSASSVSAGVNISKAIRDGFIQENVHPLNMPENFNPVPPYYSQTDVFYGFNLYRVLNKIEYLFTSDPTRYAAELTSWLRDEGAVLPEDMGKLRFLGNHDTVSWVWQKRRATDIYGVEGAKALWALFALIDGMLMIYQGDEDPLLYGRQNGTELKSFFKDLFQKRALLEDMSGTEYLETGSPLCAFIRGGKYLVLVNLCSEEKSFAADGFGEHIITPYGYGIYERV